MLAVSEVMTDAVNIMLSAKDQAASSFRPPAESSCLSFFFATAVSAPSFFSLLASRSSTLPPGGWVDVQWVFTMIKARFI